MLSSLLWDVASLFVPHTCPVCHEKLHYGGNTVCPLCELTAPLTNLWQEAENEMTERLWGIIPIEHAAALFWFVEGSPWRHAIHRFKYGGAWLTAYNLGRWFGKLLRQSGNFDDIDIVVPIPLHWRRRLARGYNQSEYIARGIAKELGVELDSRTLYRRHYNHSQTSKHSSERWDNVEGIFHMRHGERFADKHILLVDDVFTTGATIISAANAILLAAPSCRISVATLATTRRSVGIKP